MAKSTLVSFSNYILLNEDHQSTLFTSVLLSTSVLESFMFRFCKREKHSTKTRIILKETIILINIELSTFTLTVTRCIGQVINQKPNVALSAEPTQQKIFEIEKNKHFFVTPRFFLPRLSGFLSSPYKRYFQKIAQVTITARSDMIFFNNTY
jgi:hypothetical protein